MMRVLTLLPLTLGLLGTASVAGPTCNDLKQALKGPKSVTYQMVTKDREIMPGKVVKGKTYTSTQTVKAIPNGTQVTITSEGKTNVVKSVCQGGKVVIEVNGERLPAELVQSTTNNLNDVSNFDFTKQKVGDVWSGTLSSAKTGDVSSESTYKNKILKMEKVTTPAGTFDTYKVEMQITVKMTHKNMPKGMKLPGTIVTKTTMWYAKDVGVVKSSSQDMTMTLLKYSK